MEKKRVTFSAKIQPVEKLNDEFLKCTVYVCALGKNRNFSHISRDAADEALYSLYNIPIIGHLYEDENGALHMGGHDMIVEKDKDGKYVYKSLCVPYGVVPTQDNIHYEDIKEPNGDIKSYVVADCLLWIGRFPELMDAIYAEDWMFSQSMEINVADYAPLEEDKNYTDILHYTYSALCLLGKSDDEDYNVEPCFPESRVSVNYEFETDSKFIALMEEFKSDLSKYFGKNGGKEGEKIMTDETLNTMDEYEASDVQTGAEDDSTVDNVSEEFVAVNASAEATTDATESVEPAEPERFSYRDMANALSESMPNSENVFYWVCDFDEQYVYVERDVFNNGCWSEAKGRFGYAYDASAREAKLTSEFEEMFVMWLTATERTQIDALRAQYEELKAYKASREKEDRDNAMNEALKAFSDLAGNEEFEAVVANRDSYVTVDELCNACYIIRGKYGLFAQSPKNKEISVPIGAPRTETLTLREKLHESYGKR